MVDVGLEIGVTLESSIASHIESHVRPKFIDAGRSSAFRPISSLLLLPIFSLFSLFSFKMPML